MPATKLPMLLQLENDAKLDIPAGQKDFLVTDEFTLPIDVELLAIYPHAHYLGKDIQAFATLPDGTNEDADSHSALEFELAGSVSLCGARAVAQGNEGEPALRVRQFGGESAESESSARARVMGGNRSSDEMCHLWLQVLPVNFRCRRRAIRGWRCRRHWRGTTWRRIPATSKRTTTWRRCCRPKNKLDAAIREYEAAVRLRPDDAAANNALGAALVAAGASRTGVGYLRAALKARPDYFEAHYNLGLALAGQNDFEERRSSFSLALQLQPQDANVEANLGAALAEIGAFPEAKSHFERALQIDPNQPIAKENLEALQKEMNRTDT